MPCFLDSDFFLNLAKKVLDEDLVRPEVAGGGDDGFPAGDWPEFKKLNDDDMFCDFNELLTAGGDD